MIYICLLEGVIGLELGFDDDTDAGFTDGIAVGVVDDMLWTYCNHSTFKQRRLFYRDDMFKQLGWETDTLGIIQFIHHVLN